MTYRHCSVIDADCRYITYVLVLDDKVQHYTLSDGECLIDANPPVCKQQIGDAGLIVPAWDVNTASWVEGATAGEIAEWEELHRDSRPIDIVRAEKLAELSDSCNAAITAGMDVETTQGSEHFSLQETDQINLTTALSAVQSGAAGYPYHADGQLCRLFTAAEIQAIAEASVRHKLYHTTLCNHLLTWARRAETKEELSGMTYSADGMPEDLAANMAAVLEAAGDNNA